MLTIAAGIILAVVILGALGAAWGALSGAGDREHPPESERSIAKRKALQAKLARGPCYLDKRGGVRVGLRKWDWPG